MGANPSKLAEQDNVPSRKPLRPRSSLNLLKRARTASNPTRASFPVSVPVPAPVPAKVTVDVDDDVGYINNTSQLDELSSPASSEQSPGSPLHNSLLSSTIEDLEDDRSSISSTGTVNRVTTPANLEKHAAPTTPPNGDSRISTPDPGTTPRILLSLPPMLPEDSPTKYGLRSGQTPSPDRTLTRAQRRDMTGPGLFAHSVAQLKSCAQPWSDSSAKHTTSFSQSSPCLLTSGRRQHEHAKSLPTGATLANRSDHDILSGGSHFYQFVHALPMQPSQIQCFHQHDGWHAAAKPRYNILHPVSCAVCDGYGAPSEGAEAAGDDFRRCNWCWLIVCGKCYDAFVSGGLSAMMDRKQGAAADTQSLASQQMMVAAM